MAAFFEIFGSAEELLPRICSRTLKQHGVVYFADFADGTMKVGMTRGAKSRIRNFEKTAVSYGKPFPVRFAVSPILTNHEEIEKSLHRMLSEHWIERELFCITEDVLKNAASQLKMNVLRSCMWPALKGYFNYYGKPSVRAPIQRIVQQA